MHTVRQILTKYFYLMYFHIIHFDHIILVPVFPATLPHNFISLWKTNQSMKIKIKTNNEPTKKKITQTKKKDTKKQ